jgi:hypothetical protein
MDGWGCVETPEEWEDGQVLQAHWRARESSRARVLNPVCPWRGDDAGQPTHPRPLKPPGTQQHQGTPHLATPLSALRASARTERRARQRLAHADHDFDLLHVRLCVCFYAYVYGVCVCVRVYMSAHTGQ